MLLTQVRGKLLYKYIHLFVVFVRNGQDRSQCKDDRTLDVKFAINVYRDTFASVRPATEIICKTEGSVSVSASNLITVFCYLFFMIKAYYGISISHQVVYDYYELSGNRDTWQDAVAVGGKVPSLVEPRRVLFSLHNKATGHESAKEISSIY